MDGWIGVGEGDFGEGTIGGGIDGRPRIAGAGCCGGRLGLDSSAAAAADARCALARAALWSARLVSDDAGW